MEATLDHVVLEVSDVAAAAAFYHAVLGFEPVRLREFLAGDAPFASVRVNSGTIIDLFPPKLWGNAELPANPNHLCFTMAKHEVEAIRERLTGRGGEITLERERNFGARGLGHSFYFQDPDGITLEAKFHHPPP
jgi:catechol 2,3-dioxygenase-like lactoylglutathione lyase family enzyme